MFKNSVRNSQETHTLCGQNAELLNAADGGTYSYQCTTVHFVTQNRNMFAQESTNQGFHFKTNIDVCVNIIAKAIWPAVEVMSLNRRYVSN
jgi:hypothetical protein